VSGLCTWASGALMWVSGPCTRYQVRTRGTKSVHVGIQSVHVGIQSVDLVISDASRVGVWSAHARTGAVLAPLETDSTLGTRSSVTRITRSATYSSRGVSSAKQLIQSVWLFNPHRAKASSLQRCGHLVGAALSTNSDIYVGVWSSPRSYPTPRGYLVPTPAPTRRRVGIWSPVLPNERTRGIAI
jgi:hypothetical protein